MLTISIPDFTLSTNDIRHCQSVAFLPILTNGICEKREINVDIIPNDMVSEAAVSFDKDVSPSGGWAPEMPLPLDKKKILVRLVHNSDNLTIAVGLQALVGSEVMHT